MVRYSKLQFRELVSSYNTHITFTPMILAKEFCLSKRSRDSDFSTSEDERGRFKLLPISYPKTESLEDPRRSISNVRGAMIAQFGGNDPFYLSHAASLIKPYVDGIDINCGCPQSWAYKEGIGSALLSKPDLVKELIRSVKSVCGESFSVSIKIRVDDDLKNTSRLIKTAIYAGVSFITVHGRTRKQPSSSKVSLDSIKFSVEESRGTSFNGPVPIVANGDVFDLNCARLTREYCGLNAVMSARGLQENPALFDGHPRIPLDGLKRFMISSAETGLIFPIYHRHLSDMLSLWFSSKEEKKYFNMLSSYSSVLDFLEETFDINL
ncbi:tRNA-dihydrouridine synthase [Phakopsora pachyrhizi]|nr:tRNA-dihydrouridine synthase [Phakopsora pachyrhizi]